MTYEYPKKLIEYLTEQEAEGNEIFTTQTLDGTMWIIKPHELKDWYVLIEWYEGQYDYQLINLCGNAVKRLQLLFAEEKK